MEPREHRRQDTPEGVDLLALADGDADLAQTLQQLRADVDQPVPNAVAAAHMRAILTESASTPAPSPGRRWRRRLAGVGGFSAVKLAAGAMAAAAATGGGLAATGNLPDAAQRGVASVAERVGIELPSPAVDAPGRPDLPGDARSDQGRENGRDDEVRPTEPGRPDTPGRSADAPGRIDDDGRDSGNGRPEDAGKPEATGSPEDTSKPDDTGNAGDVVKPAAPEGPDEDPGKPEDAGRPDGSMRAGDQKPDETSGEGNEDRP